MGRFGDARVTVAIAWSSLSSCHRGSPRPLKGQPGGEEMASKPAAWATLAIVLMALLAGCQRSSDRLDCAGIQDMSLSTYHTVMLTADRTAWAMGRCQFGELGKAHPRPLKTENGEAYVSRPVKVMNGILEVAATNYCSLLLDSAGDLYLVGKVTSLIKSFPEWQGSTIEPTKVLSDVRHIVSGADHALAVKADGSLWGFGNGLFGQLASKFDMGSYHAALEPVQVAEDVISAFAGPNATFYLKPDHSLWSCGENASGELGYPPDDAHLVCDISANLEPKWVMGNVQKVAVDQQTALLVKLAGPLGGMATGHTLVLDREGMLWGVGSNASGQLGSAIPAAGTVQPTKIMGDVKDMVAGKNSSYVLTNDGTIFGFGDTLLPQDQNGVLMRDVTSVWGRGGQLAIKTTGGGLLFYGDNHWGQLGLPGVGE